MSGVAHIAVAITLSSVGGWLAGCGGRMRVRMIFITPPQQGPYVSTLNPTAAFHSYL